MDPVITAELAALGLKPEDIGAREARSPEWAAVGATSGAEAGYVIPYFDIRGNPIPHYRIRLASSGLSKTEGRYRQLKKSPSYIYFPPNFMQVYRARKIFDPQIVILTQEEINAAKICKYGIPCVAISSPDGWKNRVLILPSEVSMSADKKGPAIEGLKEPANSLRAAIPASISPEVVTEDLNIAYGLKDLIDLLLDKSTSLVMVFDSVDGKPSLKNQKRIAELGYELRFRGLRTPNIKQLILPMYKGDFGDDTSVEDFLRVKGVKTLELLVSNLERKRTAFPRHPNPREHISTRLQVGRLSRRDAQGLALMMLIELDCAGRRFYDTNTRQPYYFDDKACTLMPVCLAYRMGPPLHEQAFGKYLYNTFSLNAGDTRVINWLASQYTGEEPIEEVEPKHIMTLAPNQEDTIALQISDSQFVTIGPDSKKPIKLHSNGSEGILFANDQVEPIEGAELVSSFWRQLSEAKKHGLPMRWLDIWKCFQIRGALGKTNEGHLLAALLCYLSPWLYRWRDIQLPVEMLIGEPGTGKSSVYSLRQTIISGRPYLRNMPNDIRDWTASVASTGGLHVTDNVHFTKAELKQQVSDEMCRIVTSPHPFVEMRKLYTTSDLLRVPTSVVFGITAVQQPFNAVDLVQRSIIINLARGSTDWDSSWVDHQLSKYGGRTAMLAHQLVAVHLFLNAVVEKGAWDPEYSANYRLAHVEQALVIMAEVFGLNPEFLPQLLSETTDRVMSETDWTLEGLKAFADYLERSSRGSPKGKFSTTDIVEWAQEQEDFQDNHQITNSRRLGRYIQAHEDLVKRMTGIIFTQYIANKRHYIVGPRM